MRQLTAVDLFCGGGGLTEGFKQSGVQVSACLDNWGPAVETHRRNHPDTEVYQEDILAFEPERLPDCDVLIGSPPCTEFSYANRGGHGDLGLGMQFVLRFLRFVHELKPKYWIMENVPRLFQSLPPRVALRRLGLAEDGHLDIPIRRILNSADYGVPQKRLRLISGHYPVPAQTHSWTEGLGSFENLRPWVPVRTVVGLLPDPLGKPQRSKMAHDPCYDIEIPEPQLTEHFIDTRLSPEEIELNRKSKTDHSWYGRMSFPDPIDRPARTVMATQTGISRETLVIEWKHGKETSFRRPTIRECACFQSFPVTYQFWGSTAQTRYKLVGNAVPPLLASALAREVLRAEGLSVPSSPIVSAEVGETPPPVKLTTGPAGKIGHSYPESRKFRDHLPGSKSHGVRVDFANLITSSPDQEAEPSEVSWESRLVAGSGKRVVTVSPGVVAAAQSLVAWAGPEGELQRVEQLAASLERAFSNDLPDADALQAAWSGRLGASAPSPPQLLRIAAKTVDSYFPADPYEGIQVATASGFPRIGRAALPVRSLAQILAVSYLCERVMLRSRKASLSELVKEASASLGAGKLRQRALGVRATG